MNALGTIAPFSLTTRSKNDVSLAGCGNARNVAKIASKRRIDAVRMRLGTPRLSTGSTYHSYTFTPDFSSQSHKAYHLSSTAR